MLRKIEAFRRDDAGDWIAELDCGHGRHVRHVPPLSERAWVLSEGGRASRIGSELDCARCDARELPDGFAAYRRTATWNEQTLPAALRAEHSTKRGVWGRLEVVSGRLRFTTGAPLAIDAVIEAGHGTWIPPELPHAVTPLGALECYVEFYRRLEIGLLASLS
jgi:tellurite resistance-related uncharacterized protein